MESSATGHDFYDVKGIVDALLAELGVTAYDINRGTEPYFHPGVSAQYVVDGKMITQYGELHPQVSKNFDLPGKVYMFEIDFGSSIILNDSTIPLYIFQ